jgi:hypothetical protein
LAAQALQHGGSFSHPFLAGDAVVDRKHHAIHPGGRGRGFGIGEQGRPSTSTKTFFSRNLSTSTASRSVARSWPGWSVGARGDAGEVAVPVGRVRPDVGEVRVTSQDLG